jgi:hypothetical protein
LPNQFSRFTALTLAAKWSSAALKRRHVLAFFQKLPRAWLASRLAELAAQHRLSAIYTTNRPHVDAGV